MNWDDFLFILSGPLMVVVVASMAAWIAHVQDAREDRRRAQRAVPGE
jgi:hypothetical protein